MAGDGERLRRAGARAARIGAVAAVALAIVTVRVVWSSRVEQRDAESHLAAGDVAGALDRFGRAARLYAPGNPFSSRALARLQELGERAEAAHEREAELAAWREVRSAILATRSFYTPRRELLGRANARIAALSAQVESPSVDPGADEAARARWHAERLAQDEAPSVAFSLLALLGLAGWIGSSIGLFFRGLDERDRLRGRAALAWGAGIVVGFALFLVGVARA